MNLNKVSNYSLLLISFLLAISSCDINKSKSISQLQLPLINGNLDWEDVIQSENKVLYFLSPECPLCQNYAKAMRDLKSEFPNVEFIGIFPGQEYTNTEIKGYLIKFKLDIDAYLDPDFNLTELLNAEITPQAFLLNKSNEVMYAGAIDNWAISLGQKRTIVTERYLEQAIISLTSNEVIDPNKSQAVGCFIQ